MLRQGGFRLVQITPGTAAYHLASAARSFEQSVARVTLANAHRPCSRSTPVRVIGIDEAGVGATGGPLVAVAVHIPDHVFIPGLYDSKRLKGRAAHELANAIWIEKDVVVRIAMIDPKKFDGKACPGQLHFDAVSDVFYRVREALGDEAAAPVAGIFDGSVLPNVLRADSSAIITAMPQADGTCASVAAASIIAKTFRDNFMTQLEATQPAYAFGSHFGYETAEHRREIEAHGASAFHRQVGSAVRQPVQPPTQRVASLSLSVAASRSSSAAIGRARSGVTMASPSARSMSPSAPARLGVPVQTSMETEQQHP